MKPKLKKVGEVQTVSFPLSLGKMTDNGATPWFATLGLGTPAQSLKFMIDTGTDNTWITSVLCTTNACKAHSRFNLQQSSSYTIVDNTPTDKSFGPWGTMTVIIGEDYWTLKSVNKNLKRTKAISSEKMNFEVTTHYTGCQFAQLACDGGIAVPSPFYTTKYPTQTLLAQLISCGMVGYPMISFVTNNDSKVGECLFGGADVTKFDESSLQWLPLQNMTDTDFPYLWSITLKSLTIGNTISKAEITSFVLDTGSSIFKGCANIINTIVSEITNGGKLPTYFSDESELNNYPTISLKVGKSVYTLKPEQYFLKLNDEYWEIGIQVLDGMPEGMLLVGSVFLDTVYSIFDFQDKYIGLALPL